jgi:hypothetical protein
MLAYFWLLLSSKKDMKKKPLAPAFSRFYRKLRLKSWFFKIVSFGIGTTIFKEYNDALEKRGKDRYWIKMMADFITCRR